MIPRFSFLFSFLVLSIGLLTSSGNQYERKDLYLSEIAAEKSGQSDNAKIKVKGTGKTIGDVILLEVTNKDKVNTLRFTVGPALVPGTRRSQPYIIPGTTEVVVPPGGTITVPIDGICIDPHKPPIRPGSGGPKFEDWIDITQLPEDWTPDPVSGWQPDPNNPVLNPVTEEPNGHTIDIYSHPEEAAPLILSIAESIINTTDDLLNGGVISTPISDDPTMERELIIQQTIWITITELTGNSYTASEFETRVFDLIPSDNIPEEDSPEEEATQAGVQEFWNTFQAVGVEAKVLKSIPVPSTEMPSFPEDVLISDQEDQKKSSGPKYCVCSDLHFRLLVYDTRDTPDGWITINDNLYSEEIRFSNKTTEENREVNANKENIQVGEKQMIILRDIQGTCDCIEKTEEISDQLSNLANDRNIRSNRTIRNLLRSRNFAENLKGLQKLEDLLDEKRQDRIKLENQIQETDSRSRRRNLERQRDRLTQEIETLEALVDEANAISNLIEQSRKAIDTECPLLGEPRVTHIVVSGKEEGRDNGHFTDADQGFPNDNNYRLTISKQAEQSKQEKQSMEAEFTITFGCNAPDCRQTNCTRTLRLKIDKNSKSDSN